MGLLDFFKSAGSVMKTIGRGLGDAMWNSPDELIAERYGIREEDVDDFFKTQEELRRLNISRMKQDIARGEREAASHAGEMESRELLNKAQQLANEQAEARAVAQAGEYGVPMEKRVWKMGETPEPTMKTETVSPDRLHRIAAELKRVTGLGEAFRTEEAERAEETEARLREGLELGREQFEWQKRKGGQEEPKKDPNKALFDRLFEYFYKELDDPEEAFQKARDGVIASGGTMPAGGGLYAPPPGPGTDQTHLQTALAKEKQGIPRDQWTSEERRAWLAHKYQQ